MIEIPAAEFALMAKSFARHARENRVMLDKLAAIRVLHQPYKLTDTGYEGCQLCRQEWSCETMVIVDA